MIIACDRCEHSFDAMHPESWISTKEEAGALCPLCAVIVLRSSEAWAVWNSCNGVFETTWRRAEAEQLIAGSYRDCDASAVPVRVMLEPKEDVHMRHWRETEDYGRNAA
jgi:hypothetical protein